MGGERRARRLRAYLSTASMNMQGASLPATDLIRSETPELITFVGMQNMVPILRGVAGMELPLQGDQLIERLAHLLASPSCQLLDGVVAAQHGD